ncbi:ribosome biogenesis GTPase Der [Carboxydocella sp. ULO1]|uniref:ribosome biogenesis GTPase Der n=1 Tax=Carboxydocella sp. ULO1 TaxID=1926599 RepID=UPI0009AF1469|nr:ribosome biogenesis GTPase Der [Carboxydocella sp. ULO1]GAW29762.1 ribosome biogenesis GTPase Der [Carboxydocella sp. ULO1]
MSKPIVAIVGRPNVGKSTLFNRLVGGRLAIVEDIPGVTRDRIYGDAVWLDHAFTVIDTGGIEFSGIENEIANQMKHQAQLAMEEADVILFVVDGKEGLTINDEEVANMLRRANKPVVLVVNKVDNFDHTEQYNEFYALGLGEPILISAAHGYNIGDLLDEVVKHFSPTEGEEEDDDVIKIAVIGRPNVGKSSLVNALLGTERVIVSDVPGTTRDAIDTALERDGQKYIIIDTAGMRRKGKIADVVERYSVIRSLRAVDRSDIVLMVIDAVEGLTEQDKKIAGYAHESGKGCILVVNKWDLVEKDDKTALRYTEKLREGLGFMQYAPVIYVSARTKKRVAKILELVKFVADQQNMRIATSVLNNLIREATYLNPPPSDRGRRLKILYATQVAVKPPTFVLFVNDSELLHFSYQRYIENQLRQTFGFEGTPIRIIPRNRQEEKE